VPTSIQGGSYLTNGEGWFTEKDDSGGVKKNEGVFHLGVGPVRGGVKEGVHQTKNWVGGGWGGLVSAPKKKSYQRGRVQRRGDQGKN